MLDLQDVFSPCQVLPILIALQTLLDDHEQALSVQFDWIFDDVVMHVIS